MAVRRPAMSWSTAVARDPAALKPIVEICEWSRSMYKVAEPDHACTPSRFQRRLVVARDTSD
jgi:hypothetical protein